MILESFMSTKIVMDFFPMPVWFRNKTFGSKTVCRLSWKEDTWKTENTIFFYWVCNELIYFKPRSLTIQWFFSSFSRFICIVTLREFDICFSYAIINNLDFYIFINVNTIFYDICNIFWLDAKAAIII